MSADARRPANLVAALKRNLAAEDAVVFVYHLYMTSRVFMAPDGAEATRARIIAMGMLTLSISMMLLVRGELLPPSRARGGFYRLGMLATTFGSYFELRFLQIALSHEMLDMQLMALDEMLVGVSPAIWLSAYNERFLVEWFSFFYYLYFAILSLMVLPSLFTADDRRLDEMAGPAVLICAVGHVVYTLVPGVGPIRAVEFAEPLNGGFWWDQVWTTVSVAGSMVDIFPSLHTAYPVFFALHAFGWRHEKPMKWFWPFLAFAALNIVGATLFLRWHWLVDVLAGLALAVSARAFGIWRGRVGERRRAAGGDTQRLWEPLFGPYGWGAGSAVEAPAAARR